MTPPGDQGRPVVSWPWWRDLADRLARQALQAVAPVLAVVTATAGRVDVPATLVTMAGVLAFTTTKGVLSALAEVDPLTGGGILPVLWSRALPAFCGVMLGFVPTGWAGLLAVDWLAVLAAATAAAGTAVVTSYLSPTVPALAGRAGVTLTT